MRYIKVIFAALVFSLSSISIAQEHPPINVFQPAEYGGASQNWSISQSKNRHIYIANNKGLLEYNGSKWSLYESPNEAILRSVKAIEDKIYTGGYQDFGYWERDKFGFLNYTSLSKSLNVNYTEDEEFWNILNSENIILFQSLHKIHIYNSALDTHSVLDFDGEVLKLFKVQEDFYFQSLYKGLYKIYNGEAVLVSDLNTFKETSIINIFSYQNGLLVVTQDKGLYLSNESEIRLWQVSSDELLNRVSFFSAIQLEDESFVLGTISNGLINITKEGYINYHITQNNGLSNNTVLSMFEDVDNNLWAGLDNGINCINMISPFTFYSDVTGTIGSVYASAIHNDFLYLGTNQGLFFKKVEQDSDFKFIPNTQGQVWFLKVLGESLFCGHNSGTYIIESDRANKISSILGTWQVKEVNGKSNLLIQGNYDGLYILEKRGSQWSLRNKIEGFDISSRYFEFLSSNEIALNHEYKGVFRIKLNDELTKTKRVFMDSTVAKGQHSSLIKHRNQILYSNKDAVYGYDDELDAFKKDTLLSKLLNKDFFSSSKLVSEDKTNTLWQFDSREIKYLKANSLSGERKIERVPFLADYREDVLGFESITHLKDRQYILGSKTGYIILDLDKTEKQEHEILINHVELSTIKDSISRRSLDITKAHEFMNKENNIKFSYSISEFLKTQKPEYRYKLKGIYDSWSNWTSEGEVTFENLPHGHYTFTVSGRVGNSLTTNDASFSFKISRPWFLSNLAIISYVLIVLLFSLFMHNAYKRYYRKQRERIMHKTTREYELKELENKQQLMRFRNDKLREDIENKNRELGISTMSLIKKNEFLSNLKNELGKVDDLRKLNRVVKIIDRNLNNSDDWNLFQEAFNNADKDFLKKIKSLHPNLTSNDLRLCAYLRLNLSSKEIAPLLNISSRSVEVKRYRLRKKIGLAHESSLSDYILEV